MKALRMCESDECVAAVNVSLLPNSRGLLGHNGKDLFFLNQCGSTCLSSCESSHPSAFFLREPL